MLGKNNVLNIRNSKSCWLGSHNGQRGFVDFDSVDHCLRAGFILIARTYREKGFRTVSEILNRFAPSTENDTESYVRFVCRKADLLPSEQLDYSRYLLVLQAMCKFETNFDIPYVVILSILKKFKLFKL